MDDDELDRLAVRFGVSAAAVRQVAVALHRTGGRQAQFDHPDLGGMGQWMPGIVMVGAMNDHALKARVEALCTEMAAAVASGAPRSTATPARWWPESLGEPGAAGGQGDTDYAYFPVMNRLAIRCRGVVTLYDSTDHRIRGVSQQQGGGPTQVAFQSDRGIVPLETLPVVE